MRRYFAVLRRRGPAWDHGKGLREQPLWREHAVFVDGLEAEGLIRLAGPLDGSNEVLLIMRGDTPDALARRLADDPWPPQMLQTVWIRPWDLQVGDLV